MSDNSEYRNVNGCNGGQIKHKEPDYVIALRAQLAEAQADNAALCAKLKLIEGIFIKYGKNIDYIINHSLGINKELWQAIKAACEVK